jgi:translation initiation factor IF-1
MSKDEILKMTGTVIEVLGNAFFRVKLDDLDKMVVSQASGKIRQNRIRIVLGDKVEVDFSPYDLDKGRISRRL